MKIKRNIFKNYFILIGVLFVFCFILYTCNFENPYIFINMESTENKTLNNSVVIRMISFENVQKFADENKYFNSIPKLIHYVYKSNYIPDQYVSFVRHCVEINRDAQFIFWSDFAAYQLVLNEFHVDLLVYSSYFSKSLESLKISDMSRYFIILKFGGIYMDLDTKCQKPMKFIPINESCFLSRENEDSTRILYNLDFNAMNSFMGCVPRHNFFHVLVKQISKSDSTHILIQTGPLKLTKVYISYNKSLALTEKKDAMKNIIVSDSSYFSPIVEPYVEKNCKGKIEGQWKIKGCKGLIEYKKHQNESIKNAIVVHLFMHLGYSASKSRIEKLTHINRINENIKVVLF